MTTTQQFTNTDFDSREEFVARVNSGEVTHVAGSEVFSRFGAVHATAWQNGSVSVNVRGRSARTQGTVWVKVGATVSCTVATAF